DGSVVPQVPTLDWPDGGSRGTSPRGVAFRARDRPLTGRRCRRRGPLRAAVADRSDRGAADRQLHDRPRNRATRPPHARGLAAGAARSRAGRGGRGATAAPTIDPGIVPRARHTLVVGLLALLGVGLLEVVGGGMRHIYAIRNRSAADARVRDAIFAHALRLDASYHDRVGPGELMTRASSDSEHVARMMDAIGHTIGYTLTVFAVAVILLVIDWRLALVVLIPLPPVGPAAGVYCR